MRDQLLLCLGESLKNRKRGEESRLAQKKYLKLFFAKEKAVSNGDAEGVCC